MTSAAPRSTLSPLPGEFLTANGLPRIEKYELLEEIGHGGMATVYRARDLRLGREVAVKVIHRHLRDNAEVASRFLSEARAAAKLHHPSIVEVFDVSADEDPERYLVAELIRGTTLRRIYLRHRDMPAEVAASVVRVLCDAVQEAHAAGVIHRDLKPENVLVELPSDRPARFSVPCDGNHRTPSLRPTGRPEASVVIKLTDFGIAKLRDGQGMTATGQVLGSPSHMAPEQVEGCEIDERADVFGLGVLLYEGMVGHLPFEGRNPAQVLRHVINGAYSDPERERPSVGGQWGKILATALARDREARTASAADLAAAIDDELTNVGITDARAEINAYFNDPEGYRCGHVKRLVPALLGRGEAAKKAGRVAGAADAFNRALALAPADAQVSAHRSL